MPSQQQETRHPSLGSGDAQQQQQQQQQQQANGMAWANTPVTGSAASMAFNRHWSSLFRRPHVDSQQQLGEPSSSSDSPFVFAQTKLAASTKDLAKLISDTAGRFEHDQVGITKLLDECRQVLKTLKEESVVRDIQHSEIGNHRRSWFFSSLVTGELISIRTIVGTAADLNLALMAKLTKMDVSVETLVALANRIENKMENNEREIAVCPSLYDCNTDRRTSERPWNG